VNAARRLAMFLLVVPAGFRDARAQISPGPLSAAHAELEGMTSCLKCHSLGENVADERCLACHQPIAWLRRTGRGLHSLEGARECVACHREHGGRGFELIHWEKGEVQSFDHARARWVLDGKHAELECRACHTPAHHRGPVATLAPGGLGERSWLGLETLCVSCHDDVHGGRLGTACADCHTTHDFSEISAARFDHDKTRYPLRGRHIGIECRECHSGGYAPEVLPAFGTCASCHEDPHGGLATLDGGARDCSACHGVDGFRPSSYTIARHRASRYPLEGAHARVECAECHGQGANRDAAGNLRAAFRFRPSFARCTDCHDDAHGAQLKSREDQGACEACHSVHRFRPSVFDVADHQALRFPLEGAHQKAACSDCHGPGRRLLPETAAGPKIGSARVLLRFSSLECTECHRDPHGGTYSAGTKLGGAKGCVACHGFRSFHETNIDVEAHARYRFVLEGAHAAVACFECHEDLRREAAHSSLLLAPATRVRFASEARACADCHDDPHGGQFAKRRDGGACDVCHDSGAFVPAARFDHDADSAFPLEGAHRSVACAKCHPEARRPDGSKGILYRPVSTRCEDCHASTPSPSRRTP
jgi:hypothetical protein